MSLCSAHDEIPQSLSQTGSEVIDRGADSTSGSQQKLSAEVL